MLTFCLPLLAGRVMTNPAHMFNDGINCFYPESLNKLYRFLSIFSPLFWTWVIFRELAGVEAPITPEKTPKQTNKRMKRQGPKIKAANRSSNNRTPAGATICLLRKHFLYSKCHLLSPFFFFFLIKYNLVFKTFLFLWALQHKNPSVLLLPKSRHTDISINFLLFFT